MDERTRTYLAGRFRDHYRRVSVPLPPEAHEREWGYIPWTADDRTRMIRHRSMMELGELGSFLPRERPRHVYFSAARYGAPDAGTMATKDWRGADLIFDLDADHLPGIDPEEASYREMLAAGKNELFNLLDFIRTDFSFSDVSIVFSGGRGYHVHIRDEGIRDLDQPARREIANYVTGRGVDFRAITEERLVAGHGRQTPAPARRIPTTGGWQRRVLASLDDFVDELRTMDDADARARLRQIEGIGDRRADVVLEVVHSNHAEIAGGNVDVHPAFGHVVEHLIEQTKQSAAAAIDEPVTTDLNRLIRLPGSLHGGSGLEVTPIHEPDLDRFNPLVDAIPDTFRGHQIVIDVQEPCRVELGSFDRSIDQGIDTVPEYVGIHLMTTGRARKARELRR